MVERIEKIENGVVVKTAALDPDGFYHCLPRGQTSMALGGVKFRTLDECADYLIRVQPKGRIRMNPDWVMIVKHIHIDGVPRENLR